MLNSKLVLGLAAGAGALWFLMNEAGASELLGAPSGSAPPGPHGKPVKLSSTGASGAKYETWMFPAQNGRVYTIARNGTHWLAFNYVQADNTREPVSTNIQDQGARDLMARDWLLPAGAAFKVVA